MGSRPIHWRLLAGLLLAGCTQQPAPPPASPAPPIDTVHSADTINTPEPGQLEQRLIAAGLVNVQAVDSTIAVDLRYSTENNFLKTDVYGALTNAYLQPDVAAELAAANAHLGQLRPGCRLIVFDGVRPRSVQQKMWDLLAHIPFEERVDYVSNPKLGSLHNFGAAVDVSIVDARDSLLDMGTAYDHFGALAYPVKEQELLAAGQLTVAQVANRKLLRTVMHGAGFFVIQSEWWHFNSCYREEARERYAIVE